MQFGIGRYTIVEEVDELPFHLRVLYYEFSADIVDIARKEAAKVRTLSLRSMCQNIRYKNHLFHMAAATGNPDVLIPGVLPQVLDPFHVGADNVNDT